MPAIKKGEAWSIPPRVKISEALGCIADGRVKISGNSASVASSSGERSYSVKWDGSLAIGSDDNASKWQGYLGYPPIAFLMLKGRLPFDPRLSASLKGIHWKKLNDQFKRDYAKTEAEAFRTAEEKGAGRKELETFAEKVLSEIKKAGFVKL